MAGVIAEQEARTLREELRRRGERLVFTNGCFDLLHAGHVDTLARARALGDRLLVAVNSDASVRRLKGPTRPLVPARERAEVLAALESVDWTLVFDEDTPLRLIETLEPDVLVKGGDWPVERIVGRDAVERAGGSVVSLPGARPDLSTSDLVERIRNGTPAAQEGSAERSGRNAFHATVDESLATLARTRTELQEAVARAAELWIRTLRAGGRILFCGNGGSAADAQHLAAELTGRFERERAPLPGLALTTDTSALTAVGNDYGFADVFARQVRALGRPGDTLVALSTSGRSDNVVRAVEEARRRGVRTVGLLGRDGGVLAERVDVALVVPSDRTARIQEVHILIGHHLCGQVDEAWEATW
ncbi:MAG: D-glycero-beta-D-manno-heptose 1-phosphate adenylyltransferase [Gemmatimonadetes bacterium]|nr:D-glycero-beta-D-manno-heptose 1-phosphate adenylyltransferase [Gemmatimonadota bacterium]